MLAKGKSLLSFKVSLSLSLCFVQMCLEQIYKCWRALEKEGFLVEIVCESPEST